ncbi:MAG TPA: non-canonical purine NTP pyrophosphatase [Dehalococcoidia bacterium]|nr:non-canonical purine NTP pyrophosphatase [Dehalococcoidia bacterium]
MTAADTPILLATTNPAKQQALRELLAGLPLRLVTPKELGLSSGPDEEGETHEAIARLKAREWSLAASMLAIATDGGLVIPALGGRWESRFTHRFAGPAADDAERLRRLLELMRPYRGAEREASWVEALAIADRGKVLASWELTGGAGVIAESAEGSPCVPGFWAFTVWYFPRLGKTYNQLSPAERDALGDHWSRLRGLVQEFFRSYLAGRGG